MVLCFESWRRNNLSCSDAGDTVKMPLCCLVPGCRGPQVKKPLLARHNGRHQRIRDSSLQHFPVRGYRAKPLHALPRDPYRRKWWVDRIRDKRITLGRITGRSRICDVSRHTLVLLEIIKFQSYLKSCKLFLFVNASVHCDQVMFMLLLLLSSRSSLIRYVHVAEPL